MRGSGLPKGVKPRSAIRKWQLCALGTVLFLALVASYVTNPETPGEGATSSRHLLSDDASDELDQYPDDLFTKEQRQQGAVILHIIGVMYMFCALAIICDEFFVPSLDVICHTLNLQDDVAGATFMAAGGSAPELATSFIGTFVSKSNVGFGTIVGSAVFNILFVIGACAIVSPSNIHLAWWPLARDSTFYAIGLGVLIACFSDRKVETWEAFVLFLVYVVYVTFMTFNRRAEAYVRAKLGLRGATEQENRKELEMRAGIEGKSSMEQMKPQGNDGDTAAEKTKPVKITFGMHTLFSSQKRIDPDDLEKAQEEEKGGMQELGDNKARRSWTIARIKVMSRVRKRNSMSDVVLMAMADPTPVVEDDKERLMTGSQKQIENANDSEDDDDDGPMDLEWPSTLPKKISYVLLAPLTFLLYYTIPDVRREGYDKYFIVTFILSILYIGFFSYFMVWWVTLVGDTLEIPSEVMGLTVLAIGTSVPDLLESVIVAQQGKGDMAISSSIGSNIFDITIGLPVPWFLFTLIYQRYFKKHVS
mmetsp:Transcript_13809/g.19172  ORF Transcript_13809/g.19172 Transcript_13809/m.19172 type:complete len:533 (-) Transcript_13809:960-2558(-)